MTKLHQYARTSAKYAWASQEKARHPPIPEVFEDPDGKLGLPLDPKLLKAPNFSPAVREPAMSDDGFSSQATAPPGLVLGCQLREAEGERGRDFAASWRIEKRRQKPGRNGTEDSESSTARASLAYLSVSVEHYTKKTEWKNLGCK